jgi:hypothetical protein
MSALQASHENLDPVDEYAGADGCGEDDDDGGGWNADALCHGDGAGGGDGRAALYGP